MNGSAGPRLHENPREQVSFSPFVPPLGERASTLWASLGVLALLPLLAGAFLLARAVPLDVTQPRSWFALGLAALGWWLALAAAARAREYRHAWLVLAAGALALRLAFLGQEPGLSDDLQRYLFEGALLSEGGNPYRSAPAAPELAAQQERWAATFQRVNHPEVPAAYPPLTLLVQAGVVSLAGGAEQPERAARALRLVFALCDLAVCVPLYFLLRARGRSMLWLVAWAWNPWVALEFAGSGHFDALGILLLIVALALWHRPWAREVALALGVATKLLPLALVPFAWRPAGRVRAAAVFGAALLVPVLLFVLRSGAWPGPRGLSEYAFRWESFNLVHRWSEALCAQLAPYDEGWSDPRRLARALALGLWLVPLVLAWRARLAPPRVAFLALAGFLVLTPTLHPWYLCWLVPFLALFRARAFLWLVTAAPLLYWPVAGWRAQGLWSEPPWLWPALALPFFALLAQDLWHARRAARP